MEYRIANKQDISQLVEMRWNFKMENKEEYNICDKQEFINECESFFKKGLEEGNWTHWIAVDKGDIVSHISISHIRKIPKPSRLHDEYGYVTNVYTKPSYRGNGIGSELMDRVNKWAEEKDFEILIVWPSKKAIPFYKRKGFSNQNEIMEKVLRIDI
ncbi:GNAT family N-acetyltransferase [Tissierella sp. MSJ-40]|uniref:GNAT family N-acetyltransferase n=1 Tax=Tissierella simiarum TaxID=2841534 RepID=A0ABS6E7U4_9FIRM|nr:GNAT family N-acetyltransferase [Tissierella simiarum]MBU5438926.1 GNAT family N-acetyltransferase [Tissierella simiarum]